MKNFFVFLFFYILRQFFQVSIIFLRITGKVYLKKIIKFFRNYLALSCKEKDDLEDYDTSESLIFLTGNANLSEKLSICIDSEHSALRCFEGRLLDNSFESAENLKFAQNRRLAMTHVERGAELTRAGKCFEAIQCFNKALNIDENCADAYVGRGAALVFNFFSLK